MSRPKRLLASYDWALQTFDCMGTKIPVLHKDLPKDTDGTELLGSWYQTDGEVHISPDLPNGARQEVECHEVVEAWNTLYEWELGHSVIQQIGGALHQFLRSAKYRKSL